MRICSPQLGLAPKSVLGGEVFDREILLGLSKKGIKVEIILPKNKPCDKNIKNWDISYLPISHFPAFLGNFLIIPYLFKSYQKNKFEILRIHQPQYLGLGCLFFKVFNRDLKLVATYHQFRESKFGLFSRFINNFWDHIICDSEFVKKKISERYKVPRSRITVVHNGVPSYLKPTKKDSMLIKDLNINGKIVLLFMGLFVERKNPLFLLDVLSRSDLKSRSDLILIFWGKGQLESQIRTRAKELGINDKIRIQKPLFGPEKNRIHNLCDIFVHPSVDEGFALAPLEAMACAKPIVITRGYSSGEAVEDGVNGILCDVNNRQSWTSAIKKLVANEILRKKMGVAGFAKVKKEFQWQIAVEKHAEVFRNKI